ncbi:MAG: hypothetical protein Q7T82_11940 [Armatimonadota bacterium]|nr:hypothetical protein [Armatimonadota bacterium]
MTATGMGSVEEALVITGAESIKGSALEVRCPGLREQGDEHRRGDRRLQFACRVSNEIRSR